MALLLAGSVLLAAPALAQDDDGEEAAACEGIIFVDSWARPAVMSGGTSAIYGVFYNPGEDDEVLVAANTEVAEAVELHETVMGEDDVMMMRPVEDGFVIPAGEATVLQPGGLHIMLIGLTQALEPEQTINLTLTFENAGEMVVTVPVRPLQAMDGMGMGMGEEAMPPLAGLDSQLSEGCPAVFFINAWARPAILEGGNGAAYGLLLNLGNEEVAVVAGQTPAAEVVELHETVIGEGDVMQMRPVEGGFVVPAGEFITLRPGGMHVMLINTADALPEGETFDLTLRLENGEELNLTVPVENRQPSMMPGMDMSGDEEGMDDREMEQ
jgi:hypothetical protein